MNLGKERVVVLRRAASFRGAELERAEREERREKSGERAREREERALEKERVNHNPSRTSSVETRGKSGKSGSPLSGLWTHSTAVLVSTRYGGITPL